MTLSATPAPAAKPLTAVALGVAAAMLVIAVAWKIAIIDAAPPPPATMTVPPERPVFRDERVVANGVIAGGVGESIERVGATPAVTSQVVRLFAHRFDFQRDLDVGDRFRLIFARTVTDKGMIVAAGNLAYAEVRGVKLYRFAPAGGKAGYFDEAGRGVEGALLRTPVYGARITSLFGLRDHPILGYTRAHQGIDFAAPAGTPIQAAGDGVVAEAGTAGGYGNWLRIRHGGGWDTGYGHIWRYAAGIEPGVRVRQGQVIAYVGSTGLATGPHLHYEVWRDGQRINPMALGDLHGVALGGDDLVRFAAEKRRIDDLVNGQARALARLP